MWAIGSSSLAYQDATAFVIPRMASVVRRVSMSLRNSPFTHALAQHVLENALERARPLADAAPAFGRQVLAFIEEDLTKSLRSRSGDKWEMNETRQAVGGTAGTRGNGCGGLEEALDSLRQTTSRAPSLDGKIIIEARLANAEHIGDVLRRRAVIAALGKNPSGCFDDLWSAAAQPESLAGIRERNDGHELIQPSERDR